MKELIRDFLIRNRAALDYAEIEDEQSLLRQGLIDSGTMVEMILFLERQFAISIEDHDIVPEKLDSLSAIVAFVREKRGENQAISC